MWPQVEGQCQQRALNCWIVKHNRYYIFFQSRNAGSWKLFHNLYVTVAMLTNSMPSMKIIFDIRKNRSDFQYQWSMKWAVIIQIRIMYSFNYLIFSSECSAFHTTSFKIDLKFVIHIHKYFWKISEIWWINFWFYFSYHPCVKILKAKHRNLNFIHCFFFRIPWQFQIAQIVRNVT